MTLNQFISNDAFLRNISEYKILKVDILFMLEVYNISLS